MISASQLKLIRSLHQKKYRERHHCFMVEGEKMVTELLEERSDNGYNLLKLFATGQWIEENRHTVEKRALDLFEISPAELQKVSSLAAPQPVLAMVKIPVRELHPETLADQPVLAFEAIRDPVNLGTILRTADWFGIRTVVCSPDSVDVYNNKVVQGSMGSIFRVAVYYHDLEALLTGPGMSKRTIFGTFLSGESLYETALGSSPVILFGNESAGISEQMERYIGKKITIPSGSGPVKRPESLNLASSVAIVCSEWRRS